MKVPTVPGYLINISAKEETQLYTLKMEQHSVPAADVRVFLERALLIQSTSEKSSLLRSILMQVNQNPQVVLVCKSNPTLPQSKKHAQRGKTRSKFYERMR